MKLLLALALAAWAQTSATHRELLLAAVDRWTPMARADSADPELRHLAEQLLAIKQKTLAAKVGDPALEPLQAEFEQWKRRFTQVQFERRPEGAPNDYAVYSAGLHKEVGALSGGAAEVTAQRLETLKTLVSPMAFAWYVERSRAGSGGSSASAPGGGGSAEGARRAPQGWTWGGAGKTAVRDLGGAEPPLDPALNAQVAKIGEHKWTFGGTVGLCYKGLKQVLAKLGVVTSFHGEDGVDEEGKPVRRNEVAGAYQFARWVENHPTLQKRRLVKRPEPAWPLAVSDIVVWGKGVCGYHETWGHIEMIYKISADKREGWAVSDHSSRFQVKCFTNEAAKVAKAREELPALRAAMAAGGSRSALAKRKAAVSAAEAALERVAVFQIGPEP